MKRIALCVSGRINRYTKFLAFAHQLSRDYDVRIFAHFWEESDAAALNSLSKFHVNKTDVYDFRKRLTVFKSVHQYSECYDVPNKSMFQGFYDRIVQHHPHQIRLRKDTGIFGMFYSIKAADMLRREYERIYQETFDCVIRCRYDSAPVRPFEFNNFDMTKLNIPDPEWDYTGINDQFAFGSPQHLRTYCDCYDYLMTYVESTEYHPESLLNAHLTKHNVPIDRPDYPVTIH